MRVFYRTSEATAILNEGFRNVFGTFVDGEKWAGVWVADRPADIHDGNTGEVVLVVDVPDEIARRCRTLLNEDEWRPCREVVIPAEILNQYPVSVHSDERN